MGDRKPVPILTPDQRVRVFVSSTMEELATERIAVREAVDRLRLSPVLFELGARAHPPQSLYRSYLEQSHIFVGIYWERYGWVAPAMDVSGLEDEYLLADEKPKLMYVKRPAPGREPRLEQLLDRIRSDDGVSYKPFVDADELETLVLDDLSLLLSEAFIVEPIAEGGPRRFTLPSDATTFIGRDSELEALAALLARDDVRMVTLTGPGGIGKTRLALRAAARAAPAFGEGAAFVPLGAVVDDRMVVDAIAAAVGMRDSSGISVGSLQADLARRSLLLVVDNFEHLMGAAGVVSTLLTAAPHVKVLATSREALRLLPEHEFAVPPLDVADGVTMFVDRARAVRPDFRLEGADRDLVDRICERLEGVPLAIELAAARSRLLTPTALLDRLDHRLDFLVGGPRDLPERQRALRDTIEWSYDLLDDAERRLFSLLGVFVGSFPLAAAEAAAPAAGLDRGHDVLDLLASLVDKSLLRVEPTSGEPRFRMLGMIADFARTRPTAEEAERVGGMHATFFQGVAADIGHGIVSGDQRRWLDVIGTGDEGEAGNLRAALAWFLERHMLDEFAEMAWSLWVPAWINGRIDEGRRLATAALATGGPMSDDSRARLLVVLGLFEMWSGDHGAAVAALGEGGPLAASLGDDEAAAAATLAESMIAGPIDGEARAEALASEALERFRRLGDTWSEAAALNVLGWLYVSQERFDGTADVFEDSVSASVAAGDEQFSAMAEVNLAEYRLHEGDVTAATALIESCIQRHRSLRLMYSVAYLLDAAARLAVATGDPGRAARLLGSAAQMRTDAGVSVWGSQLERRDRLVATLVEALGSDEHRAALATGAALTYADALTEALPTH